MSFLVLVILESRNPVIEFVFNSVDRVSWLEEVADPLPFGTVQHIT